MLTFDGVPKSIDQVTKEEATGLRILLHGCGASVPTDVLAVLVRKRFVMRWNDEFRLSFVGLMVALKLDRHRSD